jgi:hypothetical protein
MFSGAIFDTVLGLVFVFYATAVVCSGVVEMLANWTKKRAKYLLRGLRELLDDPGAIWAVDESRGRAPRTMIGKSAAPGDEKAHYTVALGRDWPDKAAEEKLKALWSTQLINHAVLKPYKHYNRLGEATRNPAYLPPSAFVLALLDLVRPARAAQRAEQGDAAGVASAQPAESNLMKVLKVLEREAKGDAAKLQADLEAWFNGQMDRVTGSYKRWAKRLAIPIALVISFGFNIDTVAVARSVYNDGAVRSAVLDVAASGNICPPAPSGQRASTDCLDTTIAGLRELKLPVGWSRQRFAEVRTMDIGQVVTKLFGLLLTTAAASLGAPFWFDQLNRLGSLRNVGTRPAKTS